VLYPRAEPRGFTALYHKIIKHGGDGREMSAGESIDVEVTHTPSGEVLYSETVVAE